jgi:CTP:molybdopterin cytidylyltransferase MocA
MTTDGSQQPRVAAMLLAGGESSRMGESKALLPWTTGEPLIAYHVRSLHEAGYAPIVVVLGHTPNQINRAIPDDIEVTVLVNEHYREGRSSSIIVGARQLASADVDAFLVASVDQPRSVEMLRSLREAWERERPAIAMPSLNHRSGHPPLFSSSLINDVLRVSEEQQGLREVIQNHVDGRLFVNMDDPLTLTNLNTREDYEAALAQAKAEANMNDPIHQLPELLSDLYRIVDQLQDLFPRRKFTPDGHLVGSLGEVIAEYLYGLTLSDNNRATHDAIAPDGRDVQIKATQGNQIGIGSEPVHLLVLKLNGRGGGEEIYNGPGAKAWAVAGKMQKNGHRPLNLNTLRKVMKDIPANEQIPQIRKLPG